MFKLKRIEEICSGFSQKKILVYGDIILDRYIFGQVERISPEAPVPVVTVSSEELRLGGAGNVAANLDRLGASGLLLGISGDDGFRRRDKTDQKNGQPGHPMIRKIRPSPRPGSFPSASRSFASTAKERSSSAPG